MKGKRKKRSRAHTKKTLGRYKSNLEKYCADQLSEYGLSFDYEEHEFVLIDSFRFPYRYWKMTSKAKLMSDRSGAKQLPIKYTPDFVGRGHDWIIETKGMYLGSHHDFPMRWKLFLRYLTLNELPYAVYLAKNKEQVDQAIQDIIQFRGDGKE